VNATYLPILIVSITAILFARIVFFCQKSLALFNGRALFRKFCQNEAALSCKYFCIFLDLRREVGYTSVGGMPL
jgi:hypothetical protein